MKTWEEIIEERLETIENNLNILKIAIESMSKKNINEIIKERKDGRTTKARSKEI